MIVVIVFVLTISLFFVFGVPMMKEQAKPFCEENYPELTLDECFYRMDVASTSVFNKVIEVGG